MARIVVPAHTDHIYWLARNIHPADEREIGLITGKGPYRALHDALEQSVVAWTGLVDDEPVCMYGVTPLNILGGAGCTWLIRSRKIERYQVAFLRLNRRFVREMLEIFPTLVNYIDAGDLAGQKWLMWLGFSLDPEPIPYGVRNLPFLRFYVDKSDSNTGRREISSEKPRQAILATF